MIDRFRGKYRFLSNFYPCDIEYEGLLYYSVEAAYQAAKTLDKDTRELFTHFDARQAKAASKELKVRSDWYKVKYGIMHGLLLLKFNDPILMRKLLETDEEELVEGNEWGDVDWGVCNGIGENNLGRLLMKVRLYYSVFGD